MDKSECHAAMVHLLFQKRDWKTFVSHDSTWLHTRQAAKKEVERDLTAQIQSYAKELETKWYDVALC